MFQLEGEEIFSKDYTQQSGHQNKHPQYQYSSKQTEMRLIKAIN